MLMTGITFASCQLNESSYQVLTPLDEENVSLTIEADNTIKNGLTSKDGWKLQFHHLYVTIAKMKPAANMSYEKNHGNNTITLVEVPTTIDIISPRTPSLKSSENKTHAVIINGVATKDDRRIEFTLSFDRERDYICDRLTKGNNYLAPQPPQQIDTSLGFERLFGNAERAASDTINQNAIGFQPLANLSRNQSLNLDEASLKTYLPLTQNLTNVNNISDNNCNLVNE
ncbi:MAG: hypothetical protein N5P05_000263 [Chroococcopsis gigantea SAG 12.99]|nr:hypothetical protein [Chroococcopsis gigantea SAG 12.99]